ncbi:hypothetical protein PPO43_08485 [Saprospira sp. CCB-QB6]|uniref:hypothetical protein n=1 Tax=Saprospira sp. CCB-QB6 TaxID=3023936 RepID=UPI00234A3143|nr:hypothetical protein [Saprospira sp. CCB-QB6]WCL80015.1 hypothetical protein PPO43_08485 [Saprospira sp. CCB-QB6]
MLLQLLGLQARLQIQRGEQPEELAQELARLLANKQQPDAPFIGQIKAQSIKFRRNQPAQGLSFPIWVKGRWHAWGKAQSSLFLQISPSKWVLFLFVIFLLFILGLSFVFLGLSQLDHWVDLIFFLPILFFLAIFGLFYTALKQEVQHLKTELNRLLQP